MQVFLNACDDQKDSHNKEIISTFNQQIISTPSDVAPKILSPLSYTFTNLSKKHNLWTQQTKERESKAHFDIERICSLNLVQLKSCIYTIITINNCEPKEQIFCKKNKKFVKRHKYH